MQRISFARPNAFKPQPNTTQEVLPPEQKAIQRNTHKQARQLTYIARQFYQQRIASVPVARTIADKPTDTFWNSSRKAKRSYLSHLVQQLGVLTHQLRTQDPYKQPATLQHMQDIASTIRAGAEPGRQP
jgi:hypothetical protein